MLNVLLFFIAVSFIGTSSHRFVIARFVIPNRAASPVRACPEPVEGNLLYLRAALDWLPYPTGLQLLQKAIEASELRLPELAVIVQPLRGVAERGRFQAPRTPLGIPPARNQSRSFEHFEVFGNRRLAHGKWLCQVRDGGVALG